MYPRVSSSDPSPEKITTLSVFALMYSDIRYIPAERKTARYLPVKNIIAYFYFHLGKKKNPGTEK